MKEYKTTSEHWNPSYSERDLCGDYDHYDEVIPDPVVPDGNGWKLVCSSATKTRLFWTWERG